MKKTCFVIAILLLLNLGSAFSSETSALCGKDMSTVLSSAIKSHCPSCRFETPNETVDVLTPARSVNAWHTAICPDRSGQEYRPLYPSSGQRETSCQEVFDTIPLSIKLCSWLI